MQKLILLCLLLNISLLYAQDATIKNIQSESRRTIQKDVPDTLNNAWFKGGNLNLNGTQGTLKNWASGGDKFSMAINTYLNYFVFYKKGKSNWDNTFDFNFGYLQSSSIGSRKNDDRFDFLSKYGYNFNGKWYLTGLTNLRSQLFDGYSFDETESTLTSTFLSPAYLLVSAGIDFKPITNLSLFISPISTRYIIVANKKLAAMGLYGVPAGKSYINEIGAFSTMNWVKTINKNISYRGRIDLFSNYKKKPGNIDVYITNYFSFKISRSFSASYGLDLIYDDDVRLFGKDGTSAGLQLKSLIGLGFQMKLK